MRAVVVTCASPIDPAALEAGVAVVRGLLPELELEVLDAASHPRLSYLAGDDATRGAGLVEAIARRPDLVWMARGGYGSLRALAAVEAELDAVQRDGPVPLWGFSDGTALAAHWVERGWPCWSAPPLVQFPRLDPTSRERLVRALRGEPCETFVDLVPMREGRASGVLVGGNLTLLASLCGTRWQVSGRDRILVVEDVGEVAYRVDRLLSQLAFAGSLEGLRGLVFGTFTSVSEREAALIERTLEAFAERLDVPVARGLPFGHGEVNACFPLGGMATLSVDAATASLAIDPRTSR